MQEQFSRTQMLLGEGAMEKLKNSHVAVFGIGGVGGHVVDALVRSGVGAITIVDKDTVSVSNINRQLIANHETVGRIKVDVMELFLRVRLMHHTLIARTCGTRFVGIDTRNQD